MIKLQATATFRPRGDMGRWVEANVTPAVIAGVTKSLQLIEESAKGYCPVATGALQASITSEVDTSGTTVKGKVGPHTHYAAFVEFGTGIRGSQSAGAGNYTEHGVAYSPTWPGMIAQPFMRPALDENRDKVKDIMRGEIALALR